MQIKSFADCATMWATRKRKLDHNTYLVQNVDPDWAKCYFAVKLHATEIVKYFEDGRVTLDSGGWKTVATKARMNDHSPFSISQARAQWTARFNGDDYPYADGITLHHDATITGACEDPQAEVKLRRRVLKFARDYMAAFGRNEVPAPSAGDCWFCLMRTQTGESLGDASHDTSHLHSHLDEQYFVPSILAQVIAEDATSPAAHDYVAGRWAGQADKVKGWRTVAEPQLVRGIANHLLHRFGMVPTRTLYGS